MKKNIYLKRRVVVLMIVVALASLTVWFAHSQYDRIQARNASYDKAIAARVDQIIVNKSVVFIDDCVVIQKTDDGKLVGFIDNKLYELNYGSSKGIGKNPIAIQTAAKKWASQNGYVATLIGGNVNQIQENPFLTFDLQRK